jgi:hypothetical protein
VKTVIRDMATPRRYGVAPAVWRGLRAKDAKGKSVDTWYSIVDKTTLVQSINPTASTVYPIVADPRIRSAWYGYSVDLTNGETIMLAGGFGGCAGVAALMPDVTLTKVVAASCGLLGAWTGTEAGLGRCVSFKVLMPMLTVVPWGTACYA